MNSKILLFTIVISFSWINIVSADTGNVAYDKKDYSEAFRIWKPKADDGDPHYQHNIGHLYMRGYGVLKDETKALIWFDEAAYGGFAPTQYYLAKWNIAECTYSGGIPTYNQTFDVCWGEARYWVEKLYNNDDKTYKAKAENLWNKYELSKYPAPQYMKKREEKLKKEKEKSQTLFDSVIKIIQ